MLGGKAGSYSDDGAGDELRDDRAERAFDPTPIAVN